MAIDWNKPLELTNGTPVMLAEHGFRGGPNPDSDGDYWIELPDGDRECVSPEDGRNGVVTVRNRSPQTDFAASLIRDLLGCMENPMRGDFQSIAERARAFLGDPA